VLACSFVLCFATPSRAEDVRPREVRVCVRPPGEDLDRWVFSDGKVLTEHWALRVYGPRKITVYVFDPNAPAISATYFPPKLFGNLKCPAKVAQKKPEAKAAPKKSEAGPHKKKKEAEEPKAAKPEPKAPKAEEREDKEREAKKARSRKEAEEAKRERERREKQAQEEELHRQRERERPKVLPRHGVTAAWPSKVLPEQKRDGVTAAWSSKVLPAARVLPAAGAPLCEAPAPKLAGGKDVAATMTVRAPILKALLDYRKAKSPTEKEAHRRKLRELFESIGVEAAPPFQVMLSTQNALAVAFREVLKNDPLQNELLGILGKKFAPVPAQCTPPAPPPASPPGVTLPGVTLTDDGAFEELFDQVEQRITAIREAGNALTSAPLMSVKKHLLETRLPDLEKLLTRARWRKLAAFHPGNTASKEDALKRAGAATAGALLVSQLGLLAANIALTTEDANAKGVSERPLAARDEGSPLLKLFLDFRNDKTLLALWEAGMNADVPAMLAAFPAGTKAYELHIAGLDRWIASINRGAFLSKKVIQAANITMIAISIYQVWRLPAVPAGGAPTPPTILGTLPGGAAVGQVVSLASLARALEAIRRLVAIGALDGAIIGGLGSLGGGPSVALPELQRPTSLSVQGPTASPGATPSPGDKAKHIAHLIKEAQKEFPNKAGKIQLHHEHPIYLRGPKNGRTVPIDAAYHQKITNEFRNRIPYGKQNEFSDAQIDKIMKEVYEKFPLPE
jgi:hypothetical protein